MCFDFQVSVDVYLIGPGRKYQTFVWVLCTPPINCIKLNLIKYLWKYVFYKVLSINFIDMILPIDTLESLRFYRYNCTDSIDMNFLSLLKIFIGSCTDWKFFLGYFIHLCTVFIHFSIRQFAQKTPQNFTIFLHGFCCISLAICPHYGIIKEKP